MDFETVGSVWGCLCRGGDSQARPYSDRGLLVVQFRAQGNCAIALKRFTSNDPLQVIRGVLFPFPLFHSRLNLGTSDRRGE